MMSESYSAWLNIFNNDLSDIWLKERDELKNAAMLFSALQTELKKIQNSVEEQMENVKIGLERKDKLLVRKENKFALQSKENTPPFIETKVKSQSPIKKDLYPPTNESPDFTINLDYELTESEVIDLSDEIDDSPASPPIKSSRKLFHHHKMEPKIITLNIARTSDILEYTVIEETPELKNRKVKAIKSNLFLSKKKLLSSLKSSPDNHTVKSMFSKIKEKNENDKLVENNLLTKTSLNITEIIDIINNDEGNSAHIEDKSSTKDVDQDITFFDVKLAPNTNLQTKLNKTYSKRQSVSDDETFCGVNTFKKPNEHNLNFSGDSSDEFEDAVVAKRTKLDFQKPSEKKNLNGWSCENCKNFYSYLNLSPTELKKKQEDCFYKHSKKHEETMTGFWDMTIPTPH